MIPSNPVRTRPPVMRDSLRNVEDTLRFFPEDIGLFARYDSLRLTTYQTQEGLHEKIRVSSIGSATALRFDDVGYFNRVYAPDDSVAERIGEIETFYDGCPFECELIGPPAESPRQLDHACRTRGWAPGHAYAWLYGPVSRAITQIRAPGEYTVRPPQAEERTLFFQCYLRAFEALPERFPAAIRNMRHLFDRPELSFLMALKDGKPAGIGMLYKQGDAAVLCAGATLPEHRENGCHAALLAARIQLAADLGCQRLFSWAAAGGQSQANMQRAGLQTAGVTHAWRYHPMARASATPRKPVTAQRAVSVIRTGRSPLR
jgi:GNAT superfamily N-acetyltransferase